MVTEGARKNAAALFTGRKAKWLPLFRRLVARLAGIPGMQISPFRTALGLCLAGETAPSIGTITITPQGLQVGLALKKAALRSPRLKPSTRKLKLVTHHVLIAGPSDIDDELLAWVRAANLQARTARRQST